MVDEINAAIKGIGSTHECDDAQLTVDKVNYYFGGKSLSDMADAEVLEYCMVFFCAKFKMRYFFQTDLTNLKAELDAVNATSGSCPNGVIPADIEIVATSLGEGITKQRQAVKDREEWITPRYKT